MNVLPAPGVLSTMRSPPVPRARSRLHAGAYVREVADDGAIDGPALLSREDHHLAVLFPRAWDLDLAQRSRRCQLVFVRRDLGQREHAPRASEHLACSTLGRELDGPILGGPSVRRRDGGSHQNKPWAYDSSLVTEPFGSTDGLRAQRR